MDIFSYVGRVKTVKQNEILASILNVQVAASDLKSGLENIQANKIDLDEQANKWVITKSVKKAIINHGTPVPDIVVLTLHNLATIEGLCTELTKQVKSYKESLWDGKLMTVKQANLLNVIEYLNFWLRYSRVVYDALLTMNNKSVDPARYLLPAELKLLNGTSQFYNQFTVDLVKGYKSIIKNMDQLPDIEISQSSLDVMETTNGLGKVDLLQQGFGIHLINPVFWFGVGWSKWQSARIERMRRDNEYFAMKISQAINLKSGVNDPDLDRRIEIYQDKIIKNDNTIAEIEADYA